MFNALSSQLDFVGLHLLGSMVFDGLIGGLDSFLAGESVSGVVSWPNFVSWGVWEREAGSAGLINTSLFVDAVMLLLIELEVPWRPS